MSIDIERLEVDREHWNGVFPEAGTICEYQLEHDEPHEEWSRCVIEFVGNRYVVAKCWPDETMPELEQCFTKREVKFRPLKPQQERQREELCAIASKYSDLGRVIVDDILARYTLEQKP